MALPVHTRDILDNSPFAWWEWDVGRNKVEFNDLKATMLGYTVEDFHDKGYEAFTSLLHPDDYSRTMGAMKDVLSGVTDLYQVDYRILSSTKQYHWYMDRGSVLEHDKNEKPARIRGIVIDLGRESKTAGSVEAILSLFRNSIHRDANKTESIIVVCSACKKVRNEQTSWISITPELEQLIKDSFSHGLCPKCIRTLYPDFAETVIGKLGMK